MRCYGGLHARRSENGTYPHNGAPPDGISNTRFTSDTSQCLVRTRPPARPRVRAVVGGPGCAAVRGALERAYTPKRAVPQLIGRIRADSCRRGRSTATLDT